MENAAASGQDRSGPAPAVASATNCQQRKLLDSTNCRRSKRARAGPHLLGEHPRRLHPKRLLRKSGAQEVVVVGRDVRFRQPRHLERKHVPAAAIAMHESAQALTFVVCEGRTGGGRGRLLLDRLLLATPEFRCISPHHERLNWFRSMLRRKQAGWGQHRTTRRRTSSGASAAVTHATFPPQSCPTSTSYSLVAG